MKEIASRHGITEDRARKLLNSTLDELRVLASGELEEEVSLDASTDSSNEIMVSLGLPRGPRAGRNRDGSYRDERKW